MNAMIDFDGLFKLEILKLLREGKDPETLEEEYPDRYLQWLDAPNPACGGVSPNEYFSSMDAAQLMDALSQYAAAGKEPPDPLLFALEDSPDAEPLLFQALTAGPDAVKKHAAGLLNQRQSHLPLPLYWQVIQDPEAFQPLAEAAAQSIEQLGETAREPLLAAAKAATDEGLLMILDLLSSLPPDERTYQLLSMGFTRLFDRRAAVSSLLSRYGDARALPALQRALLDAEYMDYRAICDAIEALGGTVEEFRDFSGDPYYERLKIQDDGTD